MSSTTDLPQNTLTVPPSIHPTAFVAPGAHVIGDVRLGPHSSIWYNAVVRGDIKEISIGENSNIQDGSIIHVGNDNACIVGDNCTIGHHVNLHGCIIEEGCLIGIGAIILTGAVIGRGSVIGAGALVREGEIIAPGSLIVGLPGKKVRDLGEDTFTTHLKWAQKYKKLAEIHRQQL